MSIQIPPPPKRVSLIRLSKQTLRIKNCLIILKEVFQKIWGEPHVKDIAYKLNTSLKCPVHFSVLEESIRPYLGQPLTDELIDLLAAKLAGNIDKLCEGKTIPYQEWVNYISPTWEAVEVIKVKNINKDGSIEHFFYYKILTGVNAGLVLEKKINKKYLKIMATCAGFSKRNINRWHGHPMEFVGFNFNLLFSKDLEPKIIGINSSSSMKTNNLKLVKTRNDRDKTGKCKPFGLINSCFKCPKSKVECNLSTNNDIDLQFIPSQ